MTPSQAEFLAEQLERLFLALVRRRGGPAEDEEQPLTATQRLALALLGQGSPVRLGALAGRMGTTDATASRTVDALEAAGLARRQPDPDDRRGVLVTATAQGLALLAERRRRLVRILAQGLAGMSEADQGRLVALLGELADLLERRP